MNGFMNVTITGTPDLLGYVDFAGDNAQSMEAIGDVLLGTDDVLR